MDYKINESSYRIFERIIKEECVVVMEGSHKSLVSRVPGKED